MRKYSALIRKLVDVTAWAESRHEDVADTLKSRCFNDSGIVRQTLMNAVCDPRFKFRADNVGSWRNEARQALERLAEVLEARDGLTEAEATYVLDAFLREWFIRNLDETIVQIERAADVLDVQKASHKQSREINDALRLLDELEDELGMKDDGGEKEKMGATTDVDEDAEAEMEDGEVPDDALRQLGELEGEFGMKDDGGEKEEMGATTDKDEDEEVEMEDGEVPEEGSHGQQKEDDASSEKVATTDIDEDVEAEMEDGEVPEEGAQDQQKEDDASSEKIPASPKSAVGAGGSYVKNLEERYLKSIPRSLIELARKIGRMGENTTYKDGRFLRAGKTDIVGITTGDDLTALLPSEIALLADVRTQDVFYRNYTSKRLQLFASASSSEKGDKHHEGPVIVCIDTSSSMDGEPVMVAKALTVAVAVIAWRKKRDVVVVKYSCTHDYMDFGNQRSSLGRLARFLSIVSMGGNNENSMFQWLFNEVEPQLPQYESADILCVSDFGWTALDDTTLRLIEEHKAKGMRFYGLNVNSEIRERLAEMEDVPDPMSVCDSVWIYENGECRQEK